MKISKKLSEQFPYLSGTSLQTDPLIICKFFLPDSKWAFYATEFDGKEIFFGYFIEPGLMFSVMTLSGMNKIRSEKGFSVKRDTHFVPCRLSEIMKERR